MAEISAQMVKELRESTGAGMMDCKKALEEANGDMSAAVDILREKGLGKAAKKADRLASEGLVDVLVSSDNKIATISEVNSETDFVAKNENFINLVKNTTSHIQANSIQTIEQLNTSTINGVVFEDYFKTEIAKTGENLVVRRFETIEVGANGVVTGYIHSNSRVGVIIAAACDSEATASKAKDFLRNVCMHAAAMKPQVISYKDFDKEFLDKETTALKAELEKVVSEYEAIKTEYERLVKFEKDVLDSRKQAELDQIFKNFESLNGVESYEKLKVEAMNMEIGDVRKELYSIWGAINFEKQLAESKKQEEKMDSSTIVYEKSTKQASHPSGVLGKYLPIK